MKHTRVQLEIECINARYQTHIWRRNFDPADVLLDNPFIIAPRLNEQRLKNDNLLVFRHPRRMEVGLIYLDVMFGKLLSK